MKNGTLSRMCSNHFLTSSVHRNFTLKRNSMKSMTRWPHECLNSTRETRVWSLSSTFSTIQIEESMTLCSQSNRMRQLRMILKSLRNEGKCTLCFTKRRSHLMRRLWNEFERNSMESQLKKELRMIGRASWKRCFQSWTLRMMFRTFGILGMWVLIKKSLMTQTMRTTIW